MLAFSNVGGDPANEPFSDGIADELTTALGKVEGLNVAARTSAFSFKGKAMPAREIGNALQVFFKDGTRTERVQVDVPLGHRERRAEGMPVLVQKFESSVTAHFSPKQAEAIKSMFADRAKLEKMPVQELVAGLVKNK